MDFNEFLNEKYFQVVLPDTAINYKLSYRYGGTELVAMASSGKELDKEIEVDNRGEIWFALESAINKELKKRKQLFTVEPNHHYEGAGYGFYFNMDYLLKLLNK